ncbi:hypothetical protein K488DRAFT_84143 [Vararia minispora EC-137]|uniref:Uncharacterized protein n=1 Tax=Vararia minispora EC-137 TaxID=1314806 RepID=A0ACB8QRX0_9AGAM|nr:hypothetical protein K488DRAFT_84143 [Vararia minispora EC-137]
MTAVLSAVDVFRKENIMASLDDNHVNYSPTLSQADWKAKYYEMADMLAETRNELDDFHTSSKELEEELERELQRTEKAQQDLKVKLERAQGEREDWKAKFMALQTNHNTATTSLQRELDQLRAEHQKIKVQLRELEMGNDDLERNERAVTSSLADVEAKYARALEEKILLEHELLDKAHVEEECQRLKDELRDANAEISILRDQLEAVNARSTFDSSSSISTPPTPASSLQHSAEDLIHTKPPSDLRLADLEPEPSPASEAPLGTPRASISSTSSLDSESGRQALLAKAGVLPRPPQTPSSTARSSGLPTPTKRASPSTPSRIPPRTTVTRPTPRVAPAAANAAGSIPVSASRSKGVQMVSEMRAKVRNLEQKIHTRVPRMRIGSSSRPNTSAPSTVISASTSRSSNLSLLTPSVSSGSAGSGDLRRHQSLNSRSSVDNKRNGDTGWVLVMEDSPSPDKTKKSRQDQNGSPDPVSPTPSHPFSSTAPPLASPNFALGRSVAMPSGSKPPQSRRSLEGRSGIGTSAIGSSIPAPSSRPATPTFLPVPTASLYASTTDGPKRSTGPSNIKRSSLGSIPRSPTHDNYMSDSGIPGLDRPISVPISRFAKGASNSPSSFKGSPTIRTPLDHPNVTLRSSKLPALGQSRIGRPGGTTSGRLSTGGEDASAVGRPRAGSTLRF